jgi:hypothetical protein
MLSIAFFPAASIVRPRAALAWMLALGLGAPAGASAHGPGGSNRAHVHGEAALDIAVDAAGFSAELRMPMDTLVGFERAPNRREEQDALHRALERLKTVQQILRPSAAAQCSGRLDRLDLPQWNTASDVHLDIEASYRFDCASNHRLVTIEVALFDSFSRLARVDTRAVDAHGTRAQRLTRNTRVLNLTR